jgi:hypothetical protein
MFVVNLICQSTIIDFVFVSDFQDKDSAFVNMKFVKGLCKTYFTFSSRDSHSQRCVLIVFSIKNISTAMSVEIWGLRKHCQTRFPCQTRIHPPDKVGDALTYE